MESKQRSTLYNVARDEMERLIPIYFQLVNDTNNFNDVRPEHLSSAEKITILLAGLRSHTDPNLVDSRRAVEEWERRLAVPFDIESSITTGVYYQLREVAERYYDLLVDETDSFASLNSTFIHKNPEFLPFLQHIGRFPSKAKLKEEIGSVSDTNISKPAAQRLADFLNQRVDLASVNKNRVLTSIYSTLEGIVRDLVGRVLLETVVASALVDENLQFQREEEYSSLSGVLYDFRADFVLPNAENPRAFIEVRKSSSRHASLYAKDKMFSAINWKGKHKELLGVIVVDGPWTEATLDVMTRVFDYVVPLNKCPMLAKTLSAYLQGDKSKLKWMIDFRITPNE